LYFLVKATDFLEKSKGFLKGLIGRNNKGKRDPEESPEEERDEGRRNISNPP